MTRKWKTLRRSRKQAETFAAQKRAAGYADVEVRRITASDYEIRWTIRGKDYQQ